MTSVTRVFDVGRAKILAYILSFQSLRKVYRDRAGRLQAEFAFSTFIAFVLAVACAPLVVFASPLVYGVAHLWATHRQVAKSIRLYKPGQIRLLMICGLCASGSVFFLGWIPAVTFLILFNFLIVILSKRATVRLTLGILGPAIFFLLYSPIQTLIFALFFHNFVAYIFWYRTCCDQAERRTVLRSLGIVVICSAFIVAGGADPLLWRFEFGLIVPDVLLDSAAQFGDLIGLRNTAMLVPRLLSVFAFTQGLHYFVWLVALGQQNSSSKMPHSVSRGFTKFNSDAGTVLGLASLLSVIGYWIFAILNYQLAWSLYMLIQGAHAFLEVAALPALFARRSK